MEIQYTVSNQGLTCLPEFPIRMMDVTAKGYQTENGKDFVIRGALVPPDQSPTITLVDDPLNLTGDVFYTTFGFTKYYE